MGKYRFSFTVSERLFKHPVTDLRDKIEHCINFDKVYNIKRRLFRKYGESYTGEKYITFFVDWRYSFTVKNITAREANELRKDLKYSFHDVMFTER